MTLSNTEYKKIVDRVLREVNFRAVTGLTPGQFPISDYIQPPVNLSEDQDTQDDYPRYIITYPRIVFQDEPYAAGKFTANGSMTWTVEAADVEVYRYCIIDNLMFLWLHVNNTTIAAPTNTELYVDIPEGKKSTKNVGNPVHIHGTTLEATGMCYARAGETKITIERVPVTNWSPATNTLDILLQIVFEVD